MWVFTVLIRLGNSHVPTSKKGWSNVVNKRNHHIANTIGCNNVCQLLNIAQYGFIRFFNYWIARLRERQVYSNLRYSFSVKTQIRFLSLQ